MINASAAHIRKRTRGTKNLTETHLSGMVNRGKHGGPQYPRCVESRLPAALRRRAH
jgi:hypothetical protein